LYSIRVDASFLLPLHSRLGLKKPLSWGSSMPWVSIKDRSLMDRVKAYMWN
jgi:hypothetical protein